MRCSDDAYTLSCRAPCGDENGIKPQRCRRFALGGVRAFAASRIPRVAGKSTPVAFLTAPSRHPPVTTSNIGFEHGGIGTMLSRHRFAVPLNQREYAWEDEHVNDLLYDLKKAIADSKSTYFLGTIVLTRGSGDVPEVSDGQQRLATTSILLAAIRDYMLEVGRKAKADAIEKRFLLTADYKTEEEVPHLRLNADDHDYFMKRVLSPPHSDLRQVQPKVHSHKKIHRAAQIAAEHVREVAAYYGNAGLDHITTWVEFIEHNAEVILLTVPDHLNAFIMFETLNDRGLKASQADLLKNYLLRLAGERIEEVQQFWSRMRGTLEAIGENERQEDLVITYLRHLIVTLHGPTKERELFGRIEQHVTSKAAAVHFATELAENAAAYVALFQPEHPRWNNFGTTTRDHIATIRELQVEQIRPLLFAIAMHFEVAEARKAFRLMVSWSVRFLVVGGRGGKLDRHYGLRAQEIGTGKIRTAKQLVDAMAEVVPSDGVFKAAFADARISRPYVARYYLRALEQAQNGKKEPEHIPNDNEQQINLEHILPEVPDAGWKHVRPEVAAAYHKRLGNMVLLPATLNRQIGNKSFAEKQPVLEASGLSLTSDVASRYTTWDDATISDRQLRLADLAIKTWPIEAH